MAFLRTSLLQESWPVVRGEHVTLRVPQPQDYADWAELRAISREHLRPWEPEWSRDELTRASFRRRLRYYHKDIREEVGYSFFIVRTGDSQLLGGLTLSNIRRGVTQATSIGYWIGQPYAGQGYMTEAVRQASRFVFDGLALHRIEAACLESNFASMAVLERNGFQREGLARKYLKIDGRWQDHILFALLREDLNGEAFRQR